MLHTMNETGNVDSEYINVTKNHAVSRRMGMEVDGLRRVERWEEDRQTDRQTHLRLRDDALSLRDQLVALPDALAASLDQFLSSRHFSLRHQD